MVIEHYGSEERYEFPVKWDANGMAETDLEDPERGKAWDLWGDLCQKKIKKEQYIYEGDRGNGFQVDSESKSSEFLS